MDILDKEKRHQLMSKIRTKNTKPEMVVRHRLHSWGFRFRLHLKDLSGTPDIVLPKYKTVIFVNGCFWHHHEGCSKSNLPTTNEEFWRKKIIGNIDRDQRNILDLNKQGWHVLSIWECEVKNKTYEGILVEFFTNICQNHDFQCPKKFPNKEKKHES